MLAKQTIHKMLSTTALRSNQNIACKSHPRERVRRGRPLPLLLSADARAGRSPSPSVHVHHDPPRTLTFRDVRAPSGDPGR